MVNVENDTNKGDGKNVELTNNTKIEAIEEQESETGEHAVNKDQEAIKQHETLNKEESESSEDTSSEEGSESDEETVNEYEDESVGLIINQVNKTVKYHGRDYYQSLNSAGLTSVEKSSCKMTPIDTSSGEILNECGDKEDGITAPPKCKKSQPTSEVEKKKQGKICVI